MTGTRTSIMGLCAAAALVFAASWAGAGPPVRIATGPVSGVDGYLDVAPDEYGSWAVPFGGGPGPNDDHFNPAGVSLALQQAAFTSGFFLFIDGTVQRELLSDNADWQGIGFATDASLTRSIQTASIPEDRNGDGVNDTLFSEFLVSGGANALEFDLTQCVYGGTSGTAVMRQDYVILNLSFGALTIHMVKAFDGDFVWNGTFSNDEVGTSMHGAGLGTYVFEQEASDPGVTAVTLSSAQGSVYYGGKQGLEPPNGPPAFGFGTDVQVWDAFGVPASWENYIADVGYDTNGVSGATIADGFVGLAFTIQIPSLQTRRICVYHYYGRNSPCPADLNSDGSVNVPDFLALLLDWGPGPGCRPADLNCDGNVNVADLLIILNSFGPC